MLALSVIELFFLVIYVAYLVNEYAQKEVPFYIKVCTFISWLMSFGIVFMIPHDIYYTSLVTRGIETNGYNVLIYAWNIIYWLNFIMTWIVLPLFQEYEDAGEFTAKSRMIISVKNNLIIYGVFAVFGILFILYLTAVNKLELSAVLGLLVTLSNCFGVFLIVVLLGYGLIEIPKAYWRNSQYEQCLKCYRYEAIVVQEAMVRIQYEIEDTTNLLLMIRKQYEKEPKWGRYIDEIISKIPNEFLETASQQITSTVEERLKKQFGTIGIQKLAELHRKVKRLSAEYRRAQAKWEDLCDRTFVTEDLLENKHSVERRVRSTLWSQHRGSLGSCLDTLSWCWYTKLQRVYLVSLFIMFAGLSCIVLLGEISIFTHIDINILGHLLKGEYGLISIQFFVLMPLTYLSFGAYYGLFHIRLAGLYGLYNQQHTDAPSLMFGSINFSRISFPLAYNFLSMMSIKETTPFKKVVGDMDVIPAIGNTLTMVLPILLILVSVFNFFEIYDKVLQVLGLKQFQFHEEMSEKRIEDGKKLLYRARVQRERQILNQNSNKKQFRKKNAIQDIELQNSIFGFQKTASPPGQTENSKNIYKYFAFQNLDEILNI